MRSLSSAWVSGNSVKRYHRLHIRRIAINGGYENGPLDGITGSLGNFSLYLVPIGTAQIISSSLFRVAINEVAVHVLDSYDFNGIQPLGCWAEPNRVDFTALGGGQCLNNNSFRYYRHIKAAGYDFNVFTTPKKIPLATPVVLHLSRP